MSANLHRANTLALLQLAASLIVLASTVSCASLTSHTQPEPAQDIKAATKTPADWSSSGLVARHEPQFWLNDFQAPGLPALVQKALTYNHDLDAARARVQAAQARSAIAQASRQPIATVSADVAEGGRGDDSGADFSVGSAVSWEADVWGRLANSVRASEIDAQAAAADYQAARLALAAIVTRSWFASIENDMQVRLAQRTENSFRKTLDTIEDRYRNGLNSALDVRLARSNVASASNNLAAQKRELDASIRALEILLGDYPKASLATATNLPQVKTKVPAGLPSQLLARRPDLVASELRLHAAGERLEAAQKNRLPAFRLTGNTGLASTQLKDLLNWDSLVWNLLGGVTQPVFQGKRLSAEEALARAQHKEIWSLYAQDVLSAFNEVETTLAADAYYADQERALQIASKEAAMAVELATDRYSSGLENITTLLEAQRRMFTAESALLQARLARLDSRVRLYLALGGDFQTRDKQGNAS